MIERTEDRPWQDFELVDRAWRLAAEVHFNDLRKDMNIPYVSHLWSVAALVLEHGGDDAQVAAALLHDTAEDHGGVAMLDRIRDEIDGDAGRDVSELVEALSDSVVDTTIEGAVKEDWTIRKCRYLAHLADADDRVLLVSACDKLHNARCILADHRQLGGELWSRFNQSDPATQAWYYRSLTEAFDGRVPDPLANELRRTVDAIVGRIRERDDPDVDRHIAERNADMAE